jgi:CTP synthase
LANVGELKSKPAQTSVHILNGMGIQPDILVARSQIKIDKKRLDKLALFCNIATERVFAAPDLNTIYEVPLLFHKQDHHLASTCLKLLCLPTGRHKNISKWRVLTRNASKKWPKKIRVAMVGKYFVTGDYDLVDSYVSVVEALRHASWRLGVTPQLTWIDAEKVEKLGAGLLEGFDGIVVPQGWGSRGTEGKIEAIKHARENGVPYLGLCFGMQMAVIEFARNVLKLKNANTTEANVRTPHPVIHIMPKQKAYLARQQYGGTIRLGAWPCVLTEGTKLQNLYTKYGKDKSAPWYQADGLKAGFKIKDGRSLIFERHRHRYEFNREYKEKFEKAGMEISGTSPDGRLVEAVEIADHPFFIGTQFHPEYLSRPLSPHPIFLGFVKAVLG